MAKPKFDGVIEAVRYKPDGYVDWVRSFLRRGPTWSDYILLDRQTLIEHLKSGKRYMTGRRIPLMAGTFETARPLRVIQKDGKDIIVTAESDTNRDCLEDVPVL